jgi:2-polyprenyl-6-hydroxyphenyl methylase/3-demethylubiquinone-9 3-methyltransferase
MARAAQAKAAQRAARDEQASAAVDAGEVERFNRLAGEWWNPAGRMRPLHKFNPVRLTYLRESIIEAFGRDAGAARPFEGLTVLDIGCGGGLLCEPLARLGAAVTGIDPARANIEVARIHAAHGGLEIDYRADTAETLVAAGERYDVVLAMEVVEHVPDVGAFVAAAGALVKPGGLLVMATLNRTMRSFALAIVGAEYVLRWLPVGTHAWDKFVTPDELASAIRSAGLSVTDRRGVVYSPLSDRWTLSSDMAVNYLMAARRR